MSDLKWERWSWRESNSALQVLQVHLGNATSFLELFSSVSSVLFWFSREQFSEIEGGSKTEVKEGESKRQEAKKLAGRSNIERCRFSCEIVAAEAKGRGRLAMVVDFVPDFPFRILTMQFSFLLSLTIDVLSVFGPKPIERNIYLGLNPLVCYKETMPSNFQL